MRVNIFDLPDTQSVTILYANDLVVENGTLVGQWYDPISAPSANSDELENLEIRVAKKDSLGVERVFRMDAGYTLNNAGFPGWTPTAVYPNPDGPEPPFVPVPPGDPPKVEVGETENYFWFKFWGGKGKGYFQQEGSATTYVVNCGDISSVNFDVFVDYTPALNPPDEPKVTPKDPYRAHVCDVIDVWNPINQDGCANVITTVTFVDPYVNPKHQKGKL